MTMLIEPRSLFVDVAGSRRHVSEWGRAGNPVLILQHGMLDHSRNWDWVAHHFANDYHVLAPDLRGHGDSDWVAGQSYTVADCVMDIADLADALDLSTISIVGHSLGGHIALRYAATFPERVLSLTVIEGIELPLVRDQRAKPTPYPQRLRKWIDNQRERRSRSPRYYATVAEAEARMVSAHKDIDFPTLAHLTRHGLIADAGRGLRWKYDNAFRFRAPEDARGNDLDEILDAIACPALLAYGEASWIPVPPPERLSRIRDHRLVTFPAASHWLHHQSRAAFLAALTDHLLKSSHQ